jgi:hypothetical protein
VTLAVSIFDLLTYAVSGSLYFALFCYVAVRLHVVNLAFVTSSPALLAAILAVLVSYLLGYLAYPLGAAMNRVVPDRRRRNPRKEFLGRVPAAAGRDYVHANPHLLLAALELHDKDVALEVSRVRAAGLMLRGSAPALALGAVAAIFEAVFGSKPWLASGCAVLLAVWSVSLIVQGRKFGRWATLKTLELCFWLPDIDDKCRTTAEHDTDPDADPDRA